MEVIFVSGIHGVGKGSMCKDAINKIGGFHSSASSIIKAEKAEAISDDTKEVVDALGNQELLLRGISKLEKIYSTLLLDGHFTLIEKGGAILELPVELFRMLRLKRIVLIVDSAENIRLRRINRDGESPDLESIKEHQKREESHGRFIADKLAIPYIEIQAFQSSYLIEFLISEESSDR